jgi:hypothetical protein
MNALTEVDLSIFTRVSNHMVKFKYLVAQDRKFFLPSDTVVNIVLSVFDISKEAFQVKSRVIDLVYQRKILAAYLASFTNLCQEDIADLTGIKRATVSVHLKTFADLRSSKHKSDPIISFYQGKCLEIESHLAYTIDKLKRKEALMKQSTPPPNTIIPDKGDEPDDNSRLKVIHAAKIDTPHKEILIRHIDLNGEKMVSLSSKQNDFSNTILLRVHEFMVMLSEVAQLMGTDEYTDYIMSDEYKALTASECPTFKVLSTVR